jgi:hypothetical protein
VKIESPGQELVCFAYDKWRKRGGPLNILDRAGDVAFWNALANDCYCLLVAARQQGLFAIVLSIAGFGITTLTRIPHARMGEASVTDRAQSWLRADDEGDSERLASHRFAE